MHAPYSWMLKTKILYAVYEQTYYIKKKKNKQIPWPFFPQVNYTAWATATGRQNLVASFMDRRVLYGQHGGSSTAINLSFLYWRHYFSFK
jgi:hypothetical protein